MQFELRAKSSGAWIDTVLDDFDTFLLDHAANERKASAMAMSMVAHYPDKALLVREMIDLALEELNHFRQVVRLVTARGLHLGPDEKDPYVNRMRGAMRSGPDDYFLDRLLCASVIECRGAERFRLIAGRLDEPDLKTFYTTLANSEHNHHTLFVELASEYFPVEAVVTRMGDWLAIEKDIMDGLPIRPRLH